MNAVLLTRHGGPEVLRIVDVPLPEPKRGEVRVKIGFIGVNFAEVLSRRGLYGWAPPLPYILGMEASGVIDAVGEGVRGFSAGDPVIVGTQYGTYAEFICLSADRVFRAPAWLTPPECAAFPVNYLTAWVGLMEMARLRPADTLLVTTAAGGVGTAAVQIAAKFGARVIGAAGRGKEDAVRKLGAAIALDYSEEGWEEQLRKATGGRGVDVVLEMAGASIYRAALRNLAPMGRIVLAGASGAAPRSRNPLLRIAALRNLPRPAIFDMLTRSYGVMSFHIGRLLDSGDIAPVWEALVRFAEVHKIRPVMAQQFAFEEVAAAHGALEERRNVGKVIVRLG